MGGDGCKSWAEGLGHHFFHAWKLYFHGWKFHFHAWNVHTTICSCIHTKCFYAWKSGHENYVFMHENMKFPCMKMIFPYMKMSLPCMKMTLEWFHGKSGCTQFDAWNSNPWKFCGNIFMQGNYNFPAWKRNYMPRFVHAYTLSYGHDTLCTGGYAGCEHEYDIAMHENTISMHGNRISCHDFPCMTFFVRDGMLDVSGWLSLMSLNRENPWLSIAQF